MRYVANVICLMLALACAPERKKVFLERLLARSVTVQTSEGRGTGVILSKDVVLTNFHLFHEGVDIVVNSKKATVLKADKDSDLLLLSVPTMVDTSVKFSPSVFQDEEVVVIGNPLGHTGMITRGRVVDIVPGKIYIDAHVFFGSSGGGVYNAKGELLGVVVGIEGGTGDGFPFGIVIPSTTISRFLSQAK